MLTMCLSLPGTGWQGKDGYIQQDLCPMGHSVVGKIYMQKKQCQS